MITPIPDAAMPVSRYLFAKYSRPKRMFTMPEFLLYVGDLAVRAGYDYSNSEWVVFRDWIVTQTDADATVEAIWPAEES